MCNGTPFSDFSREFLVFVSAATGRERVLSPGTDVVLEVVRVAVNERFPTFMPTLYLDSRATGPRLYASLDAKWRASSKFAHNKTPAVNGEKTDFIPVSSTGAPSSDPSGTRLDGHGRGQRQMPSRPPSWQTRSSHNLIVSF